MNTIRQIPFETISLYGKNRPLDDGKRGDCNTIKTFFPFDEMTFSY
jgi:hypothetical protein